MRESEPLLVSNIIIDENSANAIPYYTNNSDNFVHDYKILIVGNTEN